MLSALELFPWAWKSCCEQPLTNFHLITLLFPYFKLASPPLIKFYNLVNFNMELFPFIITPLQLRLGKYFFPLSLIRIAFNAIGMK